MTGEETTRHEIKRGEVQFGSSTSLQTLPENAKIEENVDEREPHVASDKLLSARKINPGSFEAGKENQFTENGSTIWKLIMDKNPISILDV